MFEYKSVIKEPAKSYLLLNYITLLNDPQFQSHGCYLYSELYIRLRKFYQLSE